ncbi:MAG TPA: type II secretion system F family protein [Chthonomonadaceae bacterium]|nr:type II secretion system F family protein [Chthonomonadaceae bacterium]
MEQTRVSDEELRAFARQFADVFNGSGNLPNYLRVLIEQQTNTFLRQALSEVRDAVMQGYALIEEMAKHPEVFSADFLAMMREGEEAGKVDVVLREFVEGTWRKGSHPRIAAACPLPRDATRTERAG